MESIGIAGSFGDDGLIRRRMLFRKLVRLITIKHIPADMSPSVAK
jgi:hypothetical protein